MHTTDDPTTGQVRAHLDAEAGATARDEALAALAEHDDDQVAAILRLGLIPLLEVLVGPDPEFTADDVWVQMGDAAETSAEPRALGAAMHAARKVGLVTATDTFRPSARPAAHRRPIRVWRKAA